MQRRPHFNWPLAARVAGRFDGDLPEVDRPQAQSVVASIRLAALRAGPLAVRFSGLAGTPAERVLVVDRRTWARAAMQMVDEVLAPMPLAHNPRGARRAVTGAGYGAAGGLALGLVGRHLLGQFDAFSGEPRLFMLAPNIVEQERRHHLHAEDFRLWVAIHEQTHAVQLSAAPWLRGHLLERLAVVVDEEPGAAEVLAGLNRGHGLEAAVAGRDGAAALEEITAAMTLLEGHADFVADAAGAVHVGSVRRLRRLFSHDGTPPRLGRLLPTLDKHAQYRRGLEFCRFVAARAGSAGLAAAFESPAGLPGLGEIADPGAWLRRVHGAS